VGYSARRSRQPVRQRGTTRLRCPNRQAVSGQPSIDRSLICLAHCPRFAQENNKLPGSSTVHCTGASKIRCTSATGSVNPIFEGRPDDSVPVIGGDASDHLPQHLRALPASCLRHRHSGSVSFIKARFRRVTRSTIVCNLRY